MSMETSSKRPTAIHRIAALPAVRPLTKALYNSKENHKKMGLYYKEEDLNPQYYAKIRELGNAELEHQIGRLCNIKQIIKECEKLDGDFIEFGSWKGFSLLWIAYFMERLAIFDRQIIGLDGFVGLPYNDGVFTTEMFKDSSLKVCRRNVLGNNLLYPLTRQRISIDQFLYAQKGDILKYLDDKKARQFCFIHIDCDVTRSAVEIFDILTEGNLIAPQAYVLFDDYGCETDLKKTVDAFFEGMKDSWDISAHSETILTKNFFLKKK